MKIERINDNQIRCILDRQELAEKNIKLSELAYGSEKAKELFHDMIRQAAEEVDFEVDNCPLMIEAIPTNKDTLILVITKVENPDELDARFSRFTHINENEDNLEDLEEEGDDLDLNGLVNDFIESVNEAIDDDSITLDIQAEIKPVNKKGKPQTPADKSDETDETKDNASLNNTDDASAEKDNSDTSDADKAAGSIDNEVLRKHMKDGLSNLFAGITNAIENLTGNVIKNGNGLTGDQEPHVASDVRITPSPGNRNKVPGDSPFDVYMFTDITSVIKAAYEISSLYFSDNTLYKDESTGRFYLYATSNANTATSFEEVEKILLRYSLKCRTTYASISYYNEHFKVIRRKNAMQLLATI